MFYCWRLCHSSSVRWFTNRPRLCSPVSFWQEDLGKIGNHQMSCFAVSNVTGLKYRWGDGTLGLALIFWEKRDASWYTFLNIIWWGITPIDWFSMLKNHNICFIVHHFLGKSSFTSSKSMCLMSTGGAKKGQARGQVGEDIACTCRVLSSGAGCFPQSQQTESRSRSRSRREDKFRGHKGHTWTDQEGLEYDHVCIKIVKYMKIIYIVPGTRGRQTSYADSNMQTSTQSLAA